MSMVPPNLDENDLIALIEGEAVSNPAAIREAIIARPELGRLLVQMRADRAALRSSSVSAPMGIIDELEARLEREALVSIARTEPLVLTPPVSTVVVASPNRFQELLRSRSMRRYAMAAGLALVGGVSLLVAWSAMQSTRTPPTDVRSHASNFPDTTPTDGGLADPSSRMASATVLTDLDPFDTTFSEKPGLARSLVSRPEDAPWFTDPLPSALPTSDHTITLARAVELAREGRLAIRVHTVAGSAQASSDRVLALSARTSKNVKWRTLESTPTLLAALAPVASPRSDAPPEGERAIAGTDVGTKATGLPVAPKKIVLSAAPELRPLYAAELDADELSLESLRASLRDDSTGDVEFVEFVELPQPAPITMSLDPASMLWWGRTPSQWGGRIAVPVVLD